MLGLITLGDRVSGATYSLQDFDMLKCVGDHAAASLLNVQLSQKLLQTKELEAFQTMAAFFVHDLKNAASTLNLMLQNLPIHFNDPAFRADTLRGISKTVTHINNLIARDIDNVGRRFQQFQGTERFYLPEFYVPATMTSQIEPGAAYLENRDTQMDSTGISPANLRRPDHARTLSPR